NGRRARSRNVVSRSTTNLVRQDRFRLRVSFQVTLPTSSDFLLGGANTTIRPSCNVTTVFSPHVELTSALHYKQSIQLSHGVPAKQFEPHVASNARIITITWFDECNFLAP